MSEIRVPDAALDAGCSAYTAVIYRGNGTQAEFREAILAAFVAMVEAWEGAEYRPTFGPSRIILPIMEKTDDKARDGAGSCIQSSTSQVARPKLNVG